MRYLDFQELAELAESRNEVGSPSRDCAPLHLQRNLALGIANGALYTLAETLIDPALVLTWFLSRLSASNVLIGLVVPLRDAGWFIPQLFAARYQSRLKYKLPTYSAVAFTRSLAWMAMAVILLTQHDPAVLIAGFFIPYTLNSFAAGLAGLPFMDIVAKTVPARRLGTFFGTRLFLGGALGIAGSLVVRLALSEQLGQAFPTNIGQLMAIAAVFAVLGLLAFMFVVEPTGQAENEAINLAAHLGRAASLPRKDRNFRLFLAARAMLMLAQIGTPFFAVYASRELGAGAEMVSVYLASYTAAFLLSNVAWSRLSDRRGNRLVIQLGASLGLGMALLTWLAGPLGRTLVLGPHASWLFAIVFALSGAFQSGNSVGGMSLLLELAPPQDRALYVGLTNTVLGLALLSTSLGGLLVDWFGYRGLFLVTTGFYAAGLWAATTLREPRRMAGAR